MINDTKSLILQSGTFQTTPLEDISVAVGFKSSPVNHSVVAQDVSSTSNDQVHQGTVVRPSTLS